LNYYTRPYNYALADTNGNLFRTVGTNDIVGDPVIYTNYFQAMKAAHNLLKKSNGKDVFTISCIAADVEPKYVLYDVAKNEYRIVVEDDSKLPKLPKRSTTNLGDATMFYTYTQALHTLQAYYALMIQDNAVPNEYIIVAIDDHMV